MDMNKLTLADVFFQNFGVDLEAGEAYDKDADARMVRPIKILTNLTPAQIDEFYNRWEALVQMMEKITCDASSRDTWM